ncbi:PEP-CTERM sorting domain-containing protein [Algiphilus aromaticivorans]|uniref:PEP-CTERM sorting domain-containing protein n=1 Tax=Algiphilus aromaticivorans TaxID=382454 RepID=UPI0012EC5A01|nr:PEP-CTERM sorting domain-containing protein [Algiphilus aromaticivorans]
MQGLLDGNRTALATLLAAASLLLAACSSSQNDSGRQVVTLDFTAADAPDASGWEAGFADYSPEQEEIMEFASGHEPLPGKLSGEGHGLMVGATNRSDDVFMYWTGPVQGLAPETSYEARFRVEFATDSPAGCAGIGGAPGESVWVKTGMTTRQPEPVLVEEHWRMNIDKGNQSAGGKDAIIIGNVANEGSGCNVGERVWELKTVESDGAFILNTDSDGVAWVTVGTDSGFEGRTELFYTRIVATLEPR